MKSSMFIQNCFATHVVWIGTTGRDQRNNIWQHDGTNAWNTNLPEQKFNLTTEKPVVDYVLVEKVEGAILCSGIAHPYKHSA